MAFEITTQIEIKANPNSIWQTLTDFENYSKWNPFIKKVEGDVKVGNYLNIEVDGMKFKPEVLVYNESKEFRWIGKLFFKGLFEGEHKFEIIQNDNGTSTFVQSEKFRGILVPLFKKKLNSNTKNGFANMNQKLKERVESK
jgi:hypothetical protein